MCRTDTLVCLTVVCLTAQTGVSVLHRSLMRILLLTPRLPWPPTDGGRIAMARLATSLAACGADVQILSLNPRKHRAVPEGPLPIQAIDIDTSRFVIPSRGVPYVVARFISREFRDALRRFD